MDSPRQPLPPVAIARPHAIAVVEQTAHSSIAKMTITRMCLLGYTLDAGVSVAGKMGLPVLRTR